jgi:hypothetical protein
VASALATKECTRGMVGRTEQRPPGPKGHRPRSAFGVPVAGRRRRRLSADCRPPHEKARAPTFGALKRPDALPVFWLLWLPAAPSEPSRMVLPRASKPRNVDNPQPCARNGVSRVLLARAVLDLHGERVVALREEERRGSEGRPPPAAQPRNMQPFCSHRQPQRATTSYIAHRELAAQTKRNPRVCGDFMASNQSRRRTGHRPRPAPVRWG